MATDGGVKRQVTSDGATQPMWGAGNVLYYYNRPSGTFFSMDLSQFPRSLGRPLVVARDTPTPLDSGYAVGRDGRLLIVQPGPEDAAPPRFEVVLNWFEDVKQRVTAQ